MKRHSYSNFSFGPNSVLFEQSVIIIVTCGTEIILILKRWPIVSDKKIVYFYTVHWIP